MDVGRASRLGRALTCPKVLLLSLVDALTHEETLAVGRSTREGVTFDIVDGIALFEVDGPKEVSGDSGEAQLDSELILG